MNPSKTLALSSALAVVSLFAAGCGVAAPPEGAVQSQLGNPLCDPATTTSFGICPIGTSANPLDPYVWGSSRGYVIYLEGLVDMDTGYLVLGYDSTLTNVLWRRLVDAPIINGSPDLTQLNFYLNLPNTIPFYRPVDIEAGQVGGGNTNTGGGKGGGGNIPCEQVCFLTSWLDGLRANNLCRPTRTAAQVCSALELECGPAVDNCKTPVSCGTCFGNTVCTNGSCGCKARTCPKGSYLSDDGCACVKGTPM